MTEVPGGGEASRVRQIVSAFAGSLICTASGAAVGWSAPVLPILLSGREEPKLSAEEASWVGSLVTIGAFFSCLTTGYLIDLLGRKKVLLLLTLPFLVGWALILVPKTVWGLYLGRLIHGLCVGATTVTVPTYINELATPDIRGALSVFFQLQITLGLLFIYLLAFLKSAFAMTVISSTLPVCFFFCFVLMPESPPWLLSKGRLQEASRALQWLRGPTYNIKPELADIQRALCNSRGNKEGFRGLFSSRVTRRALFLALGAIAFQQACGINALVFYSHQIFAMSGASMSPEASSVIVMVVVVITTVGAVMTVDLFGRRLLMMSSGLVMALCMAALGAYVHTGARALAWVPLAALCLFNMAFSLGLGPIPWVLMTELFPAHLKSHASVLVSATSWGLAWVVTKYFSGLVGVLGLDWTFWLFGGFSLLSFFFAWAFLPETKGKTTEEILAALSPTPSPTPVPPGLIPL